jgi:Zn-dependent oligopeptidase
MLWHKFGHDTVANYQMRAQSQFLERHMLEPEVLKCLAVNKEGQVIPDDLIRKLQDSEDLGDGMFTVGQMTYARA